MITKQGELARQGLQDAIANVRELAQMEAKSRKKAWKVVQDRFEENLAKLKKLLQPK
jgi:phasin family protein